MDGVVHPNVEQAIGRDRIRKALKRYENRPADEHRYGIVRSVNEDGSYEVLMDGDVQTSRCSQFSTALVGDRVLAVTKKDGTNDLLGRLGGTAVGHFENATVNGTLHLTSTTDASGTADKNAPLIIGNRKGSHMVFDNNEIMGKASGTTVGALHLNSDGGNVTINGCLMAQNKVLWSGARLMKADQTATLSEAVSAQPNGIVLVWSYFSNNAAQDSRWTSYFIPKGTVHLHPNELHVCGHIGQTLHMAKWVLISDTSINGYGSNNSGNFTMDGVTVYNSGFVLRYVIGV